MQAMAAHRLGRSYVDAGDWLHAAGAFELAFEYLADGLEAAVRELRNYREGAGDGRRN